MDRLLEKVTTFITRQNEKTTELLLLKHPSAGLQIPGGTVEPGEEPLAAALREAQEETGLRDFTSYRQIGLQEERLPDATLAVIEATKVYSRPRDSSFDWAHFRRGNHVVKSGLSEQGFTQVSYIENDQFESPNHITYQITGWVPDRCLAGKTRRHFYHLVVSTSPGGTWCKFSDNNEFELLWAPISDLPRIVHPQDKWLGYVTGSLGYDFTASASISGSKPPMEVYSEVGSDGACLLFTFQPPGLLAWGGTVDDALKRAPHEALRLRDSLEDWGLLHLLEGIWDRALEPEVIVVETYNRRGVVANGNTTATFKPDLEPLEPGELDNFIALMRRSRETLLNLRSLIPPEAYSYRSLPRRKTIDEQLRHIASAERWYLNRLWSNLPRLPRSSDAWHKLELNRNLAYEALGSMTPQELGMTEKVNGETWTPRKVIRRFLYHERFHLDTVTRDLRRFQTCQG